MLLFYCGVLPNVHNVDEHCILFYKKLKCHSSALLRVLAKICYPEILLIANKYNNYSLSGRFCWPGQMLCLAGIYGQCNVGLIFFFSFVYCEAFSLV